MVTLLLLASEEIPVVVLQDYIKDRIVEECKSDPRCVKYNEDEFLKQLLREMENEKHNNQIHIN